MNEGACLRRVWREEMRAGREEERGRREMDLRWFAQCMGGPVLYRPLRHEANWLGTPARDRVRLGLSSFTVVLTTLCSSHLELKIRREFRTLQCSLSSEVQIGHFRAVVLQTGRIFLCSKIAPCVGPPYLPEASFHGILIMKEHFFHVPIKFTLGLHGLGPSARL
jgi:hypothetical protein